MKNLIINPWFQAAIKAKYGLDATAVGDEGGFAPNFQNNKVCKYFLFFPIFKITMLFCFLNCFDLPEEQKLLKFKAEGGEFA